MARIAHKFRMVGVLLWAVASSSFAADIRDTKHNLSGRLGGEAPALSKAAAEREVCVFCHTPSVQSMDEVGKGGVVPSPSALWQRNLGAGYVFDLYDDIGRPSDDGVASVGSVSMACLSCHDSTQAYGVGASADDHPFGVPYRGTSLTKGHLAELRRRLKEGGLPFILGRYIGDDSEFKPVQSAIINNRTIWWASPNPMGARQKTDLPLYPRQTGMNVDEMVPFVECTSCHDPHSTAPIFLRQSNEQSKLCLTCHSK